MEARVRPLQSKVAIVLAITALGLSGCGSASSSSRAHTTEAARSPNSYCEAFYSRAAPLQQKYQAAADAAQTDPLASIPALLSSGGDLAVVFDGMIPHAPPDIEPETVAVRDSLKQLQQSLASNASDPAAALASNVVTALTSSGSFQSVGDYLQAHCPLTSPIAQRYITLPTAAPSPSSSSMPPPIDAAAPANGTVLTSFSGDGRLNVISGGHGFSIVDSLYDLGSQQDQSTVTAYDAAGDKLGELAAGSLTGECGAADVAVPGKGRLILGYLVTDTPAQGIKPATSSTAMLAWDATTGAELWSTPLPSDSDPQCQAYDGNLDGFAATVDGRWGVIQGGVIGLADGTFRSDPKALGIISDYVIETSNTAWGDDSPTYYVTDPATGAKLGRILNDGTANGTVSGHQDGHISFGDSKDLAPQHQAGITAAGRQLFADPAFDGSAPGPHIFAYALPSMKVLWESSKSFDPSIEGEGGGILVMSLNDCVPGDVSCVVGVDDRTGRRLWKLPVGGICAVTTSQMLMKINGQYAVIDVKTGQQLSYADAHSDDCPSLLPGGIEMGTDASYGEPGSTQNITVIQVLQP